MTGMVVHRKDAYIAVKRCESLVLLKLKDAADIQVGEMLYGNMKSSGDSTLKYIETEELIEVDILYPRCSINTMREYID